jgi:hypothetical protein
MPARSSSRAYCDYDSCTIGQANRTCQPVPNGLPGPRPVASHPGICSREPSPACDQKACVAGSPVTWGQPADDHVLVQTTESKAAAAARIGAGLARRKRIELLGRLESCFVRTEAWQQAGKYVSALGSELPKRSGGLGVAYFDHERDIDAHRLAGQLNSIFAAFSRNHPGCRIVIELGRYLTALAGCYVVRVGCVKTSLVRSRPHAGCELARRAGGGRGSGPPRPPGLSCRDSCLAAGDGGGTRCQRQRDHDLEAAVRPGVQLQRATVRFGDRRDDRQAEPGAVI